jgi:hypothetical protein
MSKELEHLRFPVGRLQYNGLLDEATRSQYMESIAQLPAQMRAVVNQLSEAQLDTPYRPGGWTPRQVVHHVADSHMNSFIRFKLGLTEDVPTIKPYEQSAWADLPDSQDVPWDISLNLLEALHHRWAVLLRSLKPGDWEKNVFHPEMKRNISLDFLLALYEWHGRHHVGHLELVRKN